jgi:hypothetical protein
MNASADEHVPPQSKAGHRNDKKIISSASEEIMKVAAAEEAKKNSYDFEDNLHFQELMMDHDADASMSHFNFFVDKYEDD